MKTRKKEKQQSEYKDHSGRSTTMLGNFIELKRTGKFGCFEYKLLGSVHTRRVFSGSQHLEIPFCSWPLDIWRNFFGSPCCWKHGTFLWLLWQIQIPLHHCESGQQLWATIMPHSSYLILKYPPMSSMFERVRLQMVLLESSGNFKRRSLEEEFLVTVGVTLQGIVGLQPLTFILFTSWPRSGYLLPHPLDALLLV